MSSTDAEIVPNLSYIEHCSNCDNQPQDNVDGEQEVVTETEIMQHDCDDGCSRGVARRQTESCLRYEGKKEGSQGKLELALIAAAHT